MMPPFLNAMSQAIAGAQSNAKKIQHGFAHTKMMQSVLHQPTSISSLLQIQNLKAKTIGRSMRRQEDSKEPLKKSELTTLRRLKGKIWKINNLEQPPIWSTNLPSELGTKRDKTKQIPRVAAPSESSTSTAYPYLWKYAEWLDQAGLLGKRFHEICQYC